MKSLPHKKNSTAFIILLKNWKNCAIKDWWNISGKGNNKNASPSAYDFSKLKRKPDFCHYLSKIYVHIPIWPTINKSNLIRLLIGLWHFVSIRIVKWATCRFTRPHCGCFCCSKGRCWCRSSGYNNITLTEKGNLKMSVNSTYTYIFFQRVDKKYT